MDAQKFTLWLAQARPESAMAHELAMALSAFPGADQLLSEAVAGNWSVQQIVEALKKANVDVTRLEKSSGGGGPSRAELIAAARAKLSSAQGQPAGGLPISQDYSNHPVDREESSPNQGLTYPPLGQSKIDPSRRRQPRGEKPSFFGDLKEKIGFGKKEPKPAKTMAMPPIARKSTGGGKSSSSFTAIAITAAVVIAIAIGGFFISDSGVVSNIFVPGAVSTVVCEGETPADLKGQNDCSGEWTPKGILTIMLAVGVIVSLAGDIKFRNQWLDGLTALVMAALAIYYTVPGISASGALFVFLLELFAVVIVSVMGGRDFSPTAAFFLIIGIVGGLLKGGGFPFGNVPGIAAMTAILPEITYSRVNPVSWLFWAMAHGKGTMIPYPFMIDMILLIGVAISVFECVRPAEDKTPRYGTLIAAGFGLFVFTSLYFLILHQTLAWLSYVVGFSAAVLVAALSQNERVIQTVTMHWGVRSVFDGAMLLTALLVFVLVLFPIPIF